MALPGTETSLPKAVPPRRGKLARVAFHGSLFLSFAAAAGALLVWPQWLLVEGSRQSLELQMTHEHELQDRLDGLRAVSGRLRDWQANSRRVFVADELDRYPAQVKAVAVHEGAALEAAQVTMRPVPRWRSVSVQSDAWAESDGVSGGEIQPRAVRVVLTGSFSSIYRTVGTLCGQQQLFIPDRWDITPAPAAPAGKSAAGTPTAGRLRAEVWATVFLVRQPDDAPKGRAAAGPVAAGFRTEGEG